MDDEYQIISYLRRLFEGFDIPQSKLLITTPPVAAEETKIQAYFEEDNMYTLAI